MTSRFLTIAMVLTLSASLASAGQRGQRWPDRSQGGSSGQSSGGGQGSGGSAQPAPAPTPAPARAEPRAAAPRAEAATPPAPRSGGSQAQRSGGSQIERWGMARRQGETAPPQGSPQQAQPQARERNPEQSTFAQRPTARGPGNPSSVTIGGPTNRPATGTVRAGVPDDGARVAQPRQRYPGPEDQRQAAGVAVPRGSVDPGPRPRPSGDRDRDWDDRDGRRGARVYNYYYYPRASYPYGYGSYGLGYFYYDPYAWYDSYPYYSSYPTYYPNYNGGYYQYRYGYPTGELRLQVRPRHAEVYVDGFYAGRVDDFDGFLQALRIEEGPHTIEIVAPGYQPVTFNVRILGGRKIEYKADLYRY